MNDNIKATFHKIQLLSYKGSHLIIYLCLTIPNTAMYLNTFRLDIPLYTNLWI